MITFMRLESQCGVEDENIQEAVVVVQESYGKDMILARGLRRRTIFGRKMTIRL